MTRLYLSAFQSFSVTVVDPQSGHALKELQTSGDRAGVAVALDGKHLYVSYDEYHNLIEKLAAGKFVTCVEIDPPTDEEVPF